MAVSVRALLCVYVGVCRCMGVGGVRVFQGWVEGRVDAFGRGSQDLETSWEAAPSVGGMTQGASWPPSLVRLLSALPPAPPAEQQAE